MTLDDVVAALVEGKSGPDYSVTLPDNWTQGRTAYGGITAALALASTRAELPDLPPLRSAQVAFIAPLTDQIVFAPRLMRRGRSATFVRVDATGSAGMGAAVTFVFAGARQSAVSMPPPIEPSRPGVAFAVPEAVMFAQNFDHWHIEGKSDPVDRFVRLKAPSGVHPEIELLAVADLLPPPALFNLPQVAPLSSMTWQIDVLIPPDERPVRRWRLRNVAEMHDEGLSTQAMWVWDDDGRLIASGRQLVALFG